MFAGESAFEIVEDGQQVANERFLCCRSAFLEIAPGALSKVVEVRGKAKIIVLLCGQLLCMFAPNAQSQTAISSVMGNGKLRRTIS